MNRRGFLQSILAACAAPYVMSGGIASGILMPVRAIWTPSAAATLSIFDGSGLLLATIEYLDAACNSPASAMVQRTGTAEWARFTHPLYPAMRLGVGTCGHDINMNAASLIAGSTLTMSTFRLVDSGGNDALAPKAA